MDLLEYLRLLRRRWKLLAACVAVAAAAAFVTTPAEPSNDDVTYAATHQLLRDASATTPQALPTVALYVKTGEVPRRAAARLDFSGEPAVLASRISVEPDEQVGTIDITATGSSRDQAVERANVFAEETLALLGEQATELQREQIERANERIATLQADIDDLNQRINDGEDASGTLQAERDAKLRQYGAALDQQQQILDQPPPSAGFVSLQPALPELARVEGGGFSAPTSRLGRTMLGLLLGLVLGVAAVLIIERLDTRIHEPAEAVQAFGLPVVAEVPLSGRRRDRIIAAAAEPLSAQAEAYRSLRTALLLSPVAKLGHSAEPADGPGEAHTEPRVVLVTSPAPGDGKTTTVANLAVTMAEAGRSVLVLSCDFRRPEIHKYFNREGQPGIAEVLTHGNPSDLEGVTRATLIPGVHLAAHGGSLRSLGEVGRAARELVAEARRLADVVIIDTPPMLATNDAAELIPEADVVVVVFRIGRTATSAAEQTRFLLERLGASVTGLVAIGVPERTSTSYASYYTSGDGHSDPAPAGRQGRAASGAGGDPDDQQRTSAEPPRVPAWSDATVETGQGPDATTPATREPDTGAAPQDGGVDDVESAQRTRKRLMQRPVTGLARPGEVAGPRLEPPS